MRKIIIPIDLSEISFNAARFAAKMFSGKKDVTAILYHRYETHSDRDNCISFLESLKKEFIEKGVEDVEYEHEMGGEIVDNLDRLVQQKKACLVVMGITGHSTVHDIFVGSTTLKMVNRCVCPVLIIPPDARFSKIRNVAFASEFKNVELITPDACIKSILDMFKPFLHIININSEHFISITEEYQKEKAKLETIFINYEKEFHFLNMNDFYEAIDIFVKEYKIDILLTVPHYNQSVGSLFSNTHTRKLAYHSHIPLLAAHQ